MLAGRTHFSAPADPSAVLIRCCSAAIAARVAADRSIAANSRTLFSLRPLARARLAQQHQARQVERGLRRLEPDHLAAAEKLEGPAAGLVADDRRDHPRPHRLLRRAASRTGNAGDA